MKITNILQKLLIGGAWYVGIKNISEKQHSYYNNIVVPKGQWIADPFIFEENGRHFLFCEQYFEKQNKAAISCFEIINGEAVNGKLVISEPYHLSYPCIFKYRDKYYLIPESSSNKTIDLYEALEFPYKWEHRKTLLSGLKYVDSTVCCVGEKYYLFSYHKSTKDWKLVIFSMDMTNLSLTKILEKSYALNEGRPAGFLFRENGKLLRPAQDCRKKYGEKIILYQVDRFSDTEYQEHKIDEISIKSNEFPPFVSRIHTINRDSKYEVIDMFQEKIDIFHIFKILKRSYLK